MKLASRLIASPHPNQPHVLFRRNSLNYTLQHPAFVSSHCQNMDAHLLYTQQNPSRPTQHDISIATLPRLSRDELAARILAAPPSDNPAKLAVIDVRDNDYIGGHVRGCINVPSNTLDYRMPELVRTLQDKQVVVFHCALSQVRGPGAALRYLRERERQMEMREKQQTTTTGEEGGPKDGKAETVKQQVFVLEGGFTEWQQKYGEDIRLTEGYQKDIWAYGGY